MKRYYFRLKYKVFLTKECFMEKNFFFFFHFVTLFSGVNRLINQPVDEKIVYLMKRQFTVVYIKLDSN